ncbi:DUF1189 domain-containing protein [Salipaludibacillus aurantiacus]|uniref:Maltodextrin utilization protein YvdJ n=1 Tax=Salipaludibacillus aurantiacus TaxID=1601833 RepID=A0A1H9RAU3_9BACI|nr:DUF1189 domain-containing protein [Salipaludibacillus aurantiacus]SER69053.1 Protein of unknown function [Salipaludibacillus aurantiacus]
MNIAKQFVRSLHSPETIAKFRFQKIGKTILYVFFLMLITSIPMAVVIGSNLNNIYQDIDTHLTESFPDFQIQNGVLQSETDEPVIIDDQDTTLIFDPTGEYTPADTAQFDNAFALLEREAVLNTDGFPQTFGYQEFGLDLTKDQLDDLVNTVGDLMPLIITVVILIMYLFTTALKFLGIFTLSVITLLLKRKVADQLTYKQGWILSAYAVTLPTVLFAVIEGLGLNLPFSFAIYWVIAIVMMNLVLKNIPAPRQAPEETN